MARITGECFWEAELHRLKGELQLAANVPSAFREAEQSFSRAIDIAAESGRQAARPALLGQSGTPSAAFEARRRSTHSVHAAQSAIADSLALPDLADARAFLADEGGPHS